jgi:hypothetical protein
LIRYKLVVALLLFVISVSGAILFVYVYGATFQHGRYWHGTIRRVEDTEVALVGAIASLIDRTLSPDQYEQMFGTLRGKLSVSVVEESRVRYTNSIEGRAKQGRPVRLVTRHPQRYVEVERYQPPAWNSQFAKWLTRPGEWFTSKFDHITVPFLFSLCAIFGFLLALVWRYRERHVSIEVRSLLESIVRSQ